MNVAKLVEGSLGVGSAYKSAPLEHICLLET